MPLLASRAPGIHGEAGTPFVKKSQPPIPAVKNRPRSCLVVRFAKGEFYEYQERSFGWLGCPATGGWGQSWARGCFLWLNMLAMDDYGMIAHHWWHSIEVDKYLLVHLYSSCLVSRFYIRIYLWASRVSPFFFSYLWTSKISKWS